MAKNRYYAIAHGQSPTTGEVVHNIILDEPWPTASTYVVGVEGAVYKGFPTIETAEAWLADSKKSKKSGKPFISKAPGMKPSIRKFAESKIMTSEETLETACIDMTPDNLYCYVDGSFNERIHNYSFGLICVKNQEIVYSKSGCGQNKEAVSMRQIAGELLGAIHALRYAKSKSESQVIILHDYVGVANHATGKWKRTNPFSVTYYDWMQSFFKANPHIKVHFQKVDAHSGNYFNELADVLAKKAVDMVPDKAFETIAVALGLIPKRD